MCPLHVCMKSTDLVFVDAQNALVIKKKLEKVDALWKPGRRLRLHDLPGSNNWTARESIYQLRFGCNFIASSEIEITNGF